MARTTHVAKAQQRYETVPVIDPETGQPKRTPVMRNGVQKVSKRGPVFMTVTQRDLTKPKPLETCTACRKPIEVGTPYKWIQPKSGPYGGHRMARHEACPGWQVWDYSNSLSAQLARISHDFGEAVDTAEGQDDVQTALDDASAAVTEIAEQKREGASNIEEGFGHATSASEEMEQMADSLEEWASEIESVQIPEVPDCEACSDGQKECDTCNGSGEVEAEDGGDKTCDDCSGSGEVECDECDGTGEDLEGFRDAVRDEVTIVDESPV